MYWPNMRHISGSHKSGMSAVQFIPLFSFAKFMSHFCSIMEQGTNKSGPNNHDGQQKYRT